MVNRSEIKVEKITDNVFVASCDVYSPLKVHVTMKGKSENIAREKLEKSCITVERLARLGISETKSLIEAIQPQSCQSYVSRSFLLT